MLRLSCPSCGQQLQVNERALGKSCRCPKCQKSLRVPGASGARDAITVSHPPTSPDQAATESCIQRSSQLAETVEEKPQVGVESVNNAATVTNSPTKSTPANNQPASVPGYEIIDMLGRGGMGVVYKARQIKADRLVALKMILAGVHASQAELDRFATEAHAVASLQHPNIVQIYEVGEHDGLPFFTLEFCAGDNLSKKIAGTPMQSQAAAALLEQLAQAMHAAHEKGIIHRDLKPANVLLTQDGLAKITDFGLAKKLDDAGQTRSGTAMGTPSYMPPEQAAGKTSEIGPLADVYALGAILYELLTGRPPFKGATPTDTILQVLSTEPVPPGQLNPRTPRDLETICLKCLQKEADKRYSSALALAEDLARFRAGVPIVARPVSMYERAVKWARRSPWVAGLSAAIFLLLVTLLGGAIIANIQIAQSRDDERIAKTNALKLAAANRTLAEKSKLLAEKEEVQRKKAESAANDARTETAKAKKVSEVLIGMFEASDPLGLNGYDFFTPRATGEPLTAHDILDRGAARVVQNFKGEPVLQATLMNTLGDVYRSLGLFDKAEPLLEGAVERKRALGTVDLEFAEALHNLGWLRHDQGDYDSARQLYQQALAIRVKLLSPRDPLIATSKLNLAWLLSQAAADLADLDEADKLFREAVEIRRAHYGPEHREVALALFGLAANLLQAQKVAEGGRVSLEAIGVFRKIEGESKLAEAMALFQQAFISRTLGFNAVAEPKMRQVVAMCREVLGNDHVYTILPLYELGVTLEKLGKRVEAEGCYRDCLRAVRKTVGLEHPKAAVLINQLADMLRDQGNLAEGKELYLELLDACRKRYGARHWAVADNLFRYAEFVARSDEELAISKFQEALTLYRETKTVGRPDYASALNNLGVILEAKGDWPQAESLYREALSLRRDYPGRGVENLLISYENLATLLYRCGRYYEAAPLLAQADKMCQTTSGISADLKTSVLQNVRFQSRRLAAFHAGTCGLLATPWGEGLTLALTTVPPSEPPADSSSFTVRPLGSQIPPAWRELDEAGIPLLGMLAAAPGHAQLSAAAQFWLRGHLLRIDDRLSVQDSRDPRRPTSYQKTYAMQLQKGQTYEFHLCSGNLDPFLRLLTPDGRQLRTDDDGGVGLNARLMFQPANTGDYRLVATTFHEHQVGPFSLVISPPPASYTRFTAKPPIVVTPVQRPPATLLSWPASSPSLLQQGTLKATDLRDPIRRNQFQQSYELTLEQNAVYTIELRGTFDTYLRVESASGTVLGENDDVSASDLNSRLVFRPPTTAVYRIVVTSFPTNATGSFSLTLTKGTP